MPFAVPIAMSQFWLFDFLALFFFAFIIRAMMRRQRESGGRRETRARFGIILQNLGIALAGIGPVRPVLSWSNPAAIGACFVVLLLMGGAVPLFASSSTEVGRNWSFEARTLDDHELVRSGPYARVRHPIYLAMLLFLLGLAASLGHLIQLVIAIPVFLAGTRMRTDAEERLLERSFGKAFREYRNATPALFPRIA